MRIRTKLILSFALITIILSTLGIINHVMLNKINSTLEYTSGHMNELQNRVNDSHLLVLNIHSEILNNIIFGVDDPDIRNKFLEAHATGFYKTMEEIAKLEPQYKLKSDSLVNEFRTFYLFATDVLSRYDAETIQGHKDVLVKLRTQKDQLLLNMISASKNINAQFESSLSNAQYQADLSRKILIPFIIAALLFSISFALAITRSLAEPIKNLVTNIREIENGNYQVKARVGGHGELSLLNKAFNDMAGKLDQTHNELYYEISTRKKVESVLREREETLRAVFESTEDGIMVIDKDQAITHFNSRFAELWNIPLELMAADDGNSIAKHCSRLVSDPQLFLHKVREITTSLDRSKDIIRLKDGRIYDRFSCPLIEKNENTGRVISYRDISDRMQAIDQLQKSEENYRNIFNSTNDAIFIHDLKTGKVVDANEAVTGMYKISYEDIIGKNIEDISAGFAPYTSKDAGKKIRDANKYGTQKFDWLAKQKTGDLFWVEVSLKKATIGDQERIIAAVRDVSDRKNIEESLRESEERYRSIYENTTLGIYRTTFEGNIIMANTAFVKIFGYNSEDELINLNIEGDDFPSGYNRDNFLNKFNEESTIHGFESALKRKDDSLLYIRENAKAIRDSSDKILFFDGMIEDITNQKMAELELSKLRVLLSNIVNSMPSILIGVDPDGNITQWNKQAEVSTGIISDTALGSSLQKIMPKLAKELNKVKEAIKTRNTQIDTKVAEEIEGEIRYSDITIYPLISNGVEGAVIRVDDITDKVRIEEMMIQSEKMLTVGGLAAGMAHEINNPLAGMLQNAQVVINRLTSPIPKNEHVASSLGTSMSSITQFMEKRDILKMLDLILSAGKRAAQIVENMLSFSRKSESGRFESDINELLTKTVELAANDYDLKKKCDFRTINIKYEFDENLARVPCESVKIQQVILNLLKNSAQAMAKTKRTKNPQIHIRTINEDKFIRIEVEDNGPGMDEKTKKRVFEPFFTTKSAGEGTGLGLSVSYFIISENHHGSMSVESSPGNGTNFIVRLPVK